MPRGSFRIERSSLAAGEAAAGGGAAGRDLPSPEAAARPPSPGGPSMSPYRSKSCAFDYRHD